MSRPAWTVRPLQASDRAGWEPLARAYKAFYVTEHDAATYERTWQRLLVGQEVQGLAAVDPNGQLMGLAHYLFHTSVWTGLSCYLQDLFVDPEMRGRGVAAALIEAVAKCAAAQGATRYYWLTQAHNARARALYDRVALHRGFLRYDYPLG
ncbi:GNAT family N-acetyltransferase [Paucibacter sp. PLA-PC-4]|uniref:GNAT family N-acetyltransferase n=1 Tax=Paucibacter sp. PLA-PC-4 TaxID=2993655 RepID=UPI00224A8666|nr:GNAT family N-acetyltransferase [Paucibacter sp. PLA-PC-4]MCX2865083.1 GNAT family N-acetyltransferase [Paucibacter sp. PLA-PC-4]